MKDRDGVAEDLAYMLVAGDILYDGKARVEADKKGDIAVKYWIICIKRKNQDEYMPVSLRSLIGLSGVAHDYSAISFNPEHTGFFDTRAEAQYVLDGLEVDEIERIFYDPNMTVMPCYFKYVGDKSWEFTM